MHSSSLRNPFPPSPSIQSYLFFVFFCLSKRHGNDGHSKRFEQEERALVWRRQCLKLGAKRRRPLSLAEQLHRDTRNFFHNNVNASFLPWKLVGNWNKGIRKLWLECDSTIAVQMIEQDVPSDHPLSNILIPEKRSRAGYLKTGWLRFPIL
ncbi:hypothetical protein E2542_SST13962 [Spatholobus suberectus]|nr:hypothetical protein E2542_SST13962 [Spatholobus suberectus]